MKLERLLKENMRRFNTKNLNEQNFDDLENMLGFDDGSNRDPRDGNLISKEIDFSTLEFSGIDPDDYPDFSDAYVDYAEYEDGTPLTDDELDRLDIHDEDIYDALMNRFRG
jgi:hypothetical protein